MQPSRIFAFAFVLGDLLFSAGGCAERGSDPPIIENVSVPHSANRAIDDTLRIATANLWGVSVLGLDWADDIDERFAALSVRLAVNTPMLDVVLLQEAWKDSARKALLKHEGVSKHFPHRVDINRQPGGGGLVILSRFPIGTADFHRFRAQGRCLKFWEGDCISGKGILIVQLRVGDGSLWIGNTHLIACYAGPSEPEIACDLQDPNGADRQRQIIEARQAIEGLVGDDPAVLGGDFNFSRTSRYYPSMTSAAIQVDSSDSPPPSIATNAARGWTEPGEETVVANRVDYLWTRPGRKFRWHPPQSVRPIFTEPVVLRSGERVPLSDHPILVTEICMVRANDAENNCLPAAGWASRPTD